MGKTTHQPHDAAIRARLLNTLGIYKKLAPVRTSNESIRRKYMMRGNVPPHYHPYNMILHGSSTSSGGAHPAVIGGKPVIPRQEPLKDQTPTSSSSSSPSSSLPPRLFWNPSSFSPTFSSSSPSNSAPTTSPPSSIGGDGSGSGRVSIHFDSNVSVVVIPSRHQYSNRIKRCMWSNSSEIRENAERNAMEFRAEGWDWHSVLEDDDMYRNASTGELVHPVWVNQEGFSLIEDEEEEEDSESSVLSLEWDGPSAPTLTRSLSRVTDGLNQMTIVESLNQMMIDNNHNT
jgi:hypothetical protein